MTETETLVWGSRKHDWCHLCGRRGTFFFAEMNVPDNAEHGMIGDGFYVRLCSTCVGRLASVCTPTETRFEGDV